MIQLPARALALLILLAGLAVLATGCASDDAGGDAAEVDATSPERAGPPANRPVADARGDGASPYRPTPYSGGAAVPTFPEQGGDVFSRDPMEASAPAGWEIPGMPAGRAAPAASRNMDPSRGAVADRGDPWDPNAPAANAGRGDGGFLPGADNAGRDPGRTEPAARGDAYDERRDAAPERANAGGRRERAVRVIWEALAVEKDKLLNSRYRRATAGAVTPPTRTILINESHPAAERLRAGRNARSEAGTGIISDRQMASLIKSFQQLGYFSVARPTNAVRQLFGSGNARGRVTIESDGTSYTVLSMRGQALNANTRQIPATYSKAKQAVAAMRNMTTSLTVSAASRGN